MLYIKPFLLWVFPILFSSPMLSNDAYSYAAQGLILSRGMDPYLSGPIVVPGTYADQVDPVWLYAPAPYGPLALKIQQLITVISSNDAYLSAVMMRLPALLAVVLSIYFMLKIGRRQNINEHKLFWIFALNPLIIIHMIGGAHNDAIMLLFIIISIYCALLDRRFLAYICVALAVGTKQTAVLTITATASIIAYHICQEYNLLIPDKSNKIQKIWISWIAAKKNEIFRWRKNDNGTNKDASVSQPTARIPSFIYMLEGIYQTIVVTAIFSFITFASGLSFGWMKNLSATLSINSLLSPSTLVGNILSIITNLVTNSSKDSQTIIQTSQNIGVIVGAIIMIYIAFKTATQRPIRGLTLIWGVFVLASPVVHAWYLAPVLAFAALSKINTRTEKIAIVGTLILVSYAIMDVSVTTGAWILSMISLTRLFWVILRKERLRKEIFAQNTNSGC